jgi:predicted GNAT family N-acyltransferase
MQSFRLRHAEWERDRAPLQAVRRTVFVLEQKVPEALEWDEFDPVSTHVLAEDASGQAIGTGRLLPDGHLGRMAVLDGWRGRGVGDALLTWLMGQARDRGVRELLLHAQSHAVPFYLRHGFACVGDEFIEAGIAHRLMRRAA